MTTKDTIRGYFNSLEKRSGWDGFLSSGMTFTSFTSPVKQVKGKEAYLESTKRFYSSIGSFQLRDLLVDEDKACALTRYELRSPTGTTFVSDVAELFTVKNGKIDSLAIYFDSAPFPKPPQ
jgi:ketosteroid isomerase-like protein